MTVHTVVAPVAVVARTVAESHDAAAGARVFENLSFVALSSRPLDDAAAMRDVIAPLTFVPARVVENGRAAPLAVATPKLALVARAVRVDHCPEAVRLAVF